LELLIYILKRIIFTSKTIIFHIQKKEHLLTSISKENPNSVHKMAKFNHLRKRDGTLEEFDWTKLSDSIAAAYFEAKGKKDVKAIKRVTDKLKLTLEKSYSSKILPSSKDVEELILETLTKNKMEAIAKAWEKYNEENKIVKEFRTYQGVRDDLMLSNNAIKILKSRYLLRNEEGAIVETPARMFRRVAKAIAKIDRDYDTKSNIKQTEEDFYEIMANQEFLPNTPTLMNAGTELGQLSACFVLPIGDSLPEIFEALKQQAIIQQSGGGTGFDLSQLRPEGEIISTTKGKASGPMSFLQLFDKTTDIVKQGNKRKGANMAVLRVDHPDILDFINSKSDDKSLKNFNISVAITEAFMEAVKEDKEYKLVNPKTGKNAGQLKAKEVFDMICENAWKTGDPGILFIDEINEKNPTAKLGKITATNPCGEQPLHPNESCNLGSINLAAFVKNGKPEWERMKKTIHTAVHFLDNVIDANKYPTEEIETVTKSNRRIGLGVMGFAEMLIRLGIPYNSKKGLEFADKLMSFINEEARKASNSIAETRESFENFAKSTWAAEKKTKDGTRNATVTTIAPTGTISIIADSTSGIEPIFGVAYIREALQGTYLLEVNPAFEEIAKKKGFYSKSLMMQIAKKGTQCKD
jgi:ribonucleoside-diphosphate reductase alpha chain